MNNQQRYQHFQTKGWVKFDYNATIDNWVNQARPFVKQAMEHDDNQHWWRCGNTWFVGVNLLPNDNQGNIGDGFLSGEVNDFIQQYFIMPEKGFDRAQISTCVPGYPQPSVNESGTAFNFRLNKDAAHVDGVLPINKRRFLQEYHAFILGIPLTDIDINTSPFVIWEQSHSIIEQTFSQRFNNIPYHQWQHEDITECYKSARQQVLDSCKRRVIEAKVGEVYFAHRLSVHGMTRWKQTENTSEHNKTTKSNRTICYFRPNYQIEELEVFLAHPAGVEPATP